MFGIGSSKSDRTFYEAFERHAAQIVKAGKLVTHTAKPGANYDRWKSLYDAAPDTKNEFAILDSQRDVVDGVDASVGLDHVLQDDLRHHQTS